jgi:MYXO-CTERM domain-containing protein
MKHAIKWAALTAMVLVTSLAGTADAGFVVDVSQVGSNVVATGSGSLDLTGLSFLFSGVDSPGVNPGDGVIVVGPPITAVDAYRGATGPTSFGGGSFTPASSSNGDLVAIEGALGDIVVPEGYVSFTPLSGSATWDNTTIAGLGLTPGTYTYTWGAGGPAQSLTVNVVPEPSSLAMAGMAVAAGLVMWRRRRAA